MSNEYTYTRPMPAHRFVERFLIGQALIQLEQGGWHLLGYDDGDGMQNLSGLPVGNAGEVFEMFCATDDGRLHVYKPNSPDRGWIYLIGGNGVDVISDYTMNLDAIMQKVFLR